jgi:uncharacterized membrane protein
VNRIHGLHEHSADDLSPPSPRGQGLWKIGLGLAIMAVVAVSVGVSATAGSERTTQTVVRASTMSGVTGLLLVCAGSLQLLSGRRWQEIPQGLRLAFLVVFVPLFLLGVPTVVMLLFEGR